MLVVIVAGTLETDAVLEFSGATCFRMRERFSSSRSSILSESDAWVEAETAEVDMLEEKVLAASSKVLI